VQSSWSDFQNDLSDSGADTAFRQKFELSLVKSEESTISTFGKHHICKKTKEFNRVDEFKRDRQRPKNGCKLARVPGVSLFVS
jgi:hypothetical protein